MTADASTRGRWLRIVRWFLAISYGVAAPATAFVEARDAVISRRFDLPPALVLSVCAVQAVCVPLLFARRTAPWAAAALTGTTIGALASHLRIGSPGTAVPAIVYSAVQIWFGLADLRRGGEPG